MPLNRLCNLAMLCVACGPIFVPVYLTTFAETFGGLTEAELARIPAALFAAAVAGILVCGPFADRIGAKSFAVTGLLTIAAGLVFMAVAQSFHVFMPAVLLVGFGTGLLDTILSPIVAATNARDRAPALNSLHAFYCFGAVGVSTASGIALALGLHWRTTAMLLATLPAMLALALAFTIIPPLVEHETRPHGIRKLLQQPLVLAAALMLFLAGMTEEGMAQWLPAYAEWELGFSRELAAMSLTVFATLMGLGRLAGARVVRHYGARTSLIAAGLACATLYAAGATLPWPGAALLACVGVGLGCSVLWPTILGMTADRITAGGATMFAALSAAGSAGNVLAPWLNGVIAAYSSLSSALLAGAGFPLLLAVVVLLVAHQPERTITSP